MEPGQHHSDLMRHTPVTPNKFASLSSSLLAKKKKKRNHLEVNLEEPYITKAQNLNSRHIKERKKKEGGG